jgi:hypothetical protein
MCDDPDNQSHHEMGGENQIQIQIQKPDQTRSRQIRVEESIERPTGARQVHIRWENRIEATLLEG